MSGSVCIKKGYSKEQDAKTAILNIKAEIDQPNMAAVILFCSSGIDFAPLGSAIKESFSVPVIACTTSGEISPFGYSGEAIKEFKKQSDNVSSTGGIAAVSLGGEQMKVLPFYIDDVHNFGAEQASDINSSITKLLNERKIEEPDSDAFGLLLIDGLSVAEEGLIANLYAGLSGLPIVGGSAGDDLKFSKTFIYHDGEFRSSSAIFAAFITSYPFKTFKTQHFVPGDHKMVITAAVPEKRVVTEINGLPAAQEYARFVGVEVSELEPMTFSKHPVMLKIGGEYYVRSIQKVNEDESLTFYCAIDEGLVLTIAKGVDIVDNLKETFAAIKNDIKEPKLIIGCECVLRRLEIAEKGLDEEMATVMVENNVIGFHTYGEQFNAVHVNQTFTGIAIG